MRRVLLVGVMIGVAGLSGCGASRRPAASMAVFRPGPAPVSTLGSGDSLGKVLYVNDLVLAAKAQGVPATAFTAASERDVAWNE